MYDEEEVEEDREDDEDDEDNMHFFVNVDDDDDQEYDTTVTIYDVTGVRMMVPRIDANCKDRTVGNK